MSIAAAQKIETAVAEMRAERGNAVDAGAHAYWTANQNGKSVITTVAMLKDGQGEGFHWESELVPILGSLGILDLSRLPRDGYKLSLVALEQSSGISCRVQAWQTVRKWTQRQRIGVQMSKARRLADQQTLAKLAAMFPFTFTAEPDGVYRPLAIGTHDALIALGLDRKEISRALPSYCGRLGYLRSLVAGAPRISLAGAIVGSVTAAEAESANRDIAYIEASRDEDFKRERKLWRQMKRQIAAAAGPVTT